MFRAYFFASVVLFAVGCGEETSTTPAMADIQGLVVRTVAPADGAPQVGTLYISIFENDPIQVRSEDTVPVASLTIPEVNLGEIGSEVSFELSGVPTRAEPYVLTAVFDANNNLQEMTPPGPDDGDLVALVGIKSPELVVNAAQVTAEIELNFECADGICDPLN